MEVVFFVILCSFPRNPAKTLRLHLISVLFQVIKNLVAKREGPFRILTYAQYIGLESEDKYLAQQYMEEKAPRKKRSASSGRAAEPREPPKKKEKSESTETEEGECKSLLIFDTMYLHLFSVD